MTRPLSILLVLTLFLFGCAGSEEKAPAPPTEQQSLDRAARLAFAQGQYAQAATLYQASLDEALAEDNPDAIIDARFNLALSQTYIGEYDAALAQMTQADAERVRRGLAEDPQLQLLHATILYRAGDPDHATSTLSALLDNHQLSTATQARAQFLAGLIAVDAGNPATTRSHLDKLTRLNATTGTDRIELAGRLAALEGDTDSALRHLDRAISLRGAERDYRGMVRALAAAGDIAQADGQPARAAAYLLRAGRSAAQRQEPQARAWLERAKDLASRSGESAIVMESESILQGL